MGTYLDRFRLSFIDPDISQRFIAWDWERLRLEYEQELNQIQPITEIPTPVQKTISRSRLKQIVRNKRYQRQSNYIKSGWTTIVKWRYSRKMHLHRAGKA
jgi:hypothetical protein